MRILSCGVAFAGVVLSCSAAADLRPPFDKSDYLGRVGLHLNPWFPLDKQPMHALGGPNTPWKRYEGEHIWGQGMRDLLPYGVGFWSLEVNEPVAWIGTWKELYQDAKALDLPVKVGSFFAFGSKDPSTSANEMAKKFRESGYDIRNDPHTLTAGGNPVIVVYHPEKRTPEAWADWLGAIDAKTGRNVYLMDGCGLAWLAAQPAECGDPDDPEKVDAAFERLVRKYLPAFDGISSYANGFRMPYKVLKRVMKEFPQKIYEGQVHQTYTCHFQYGGSGVDLSKSWRDSIDECLDSDPDSIYITNLFDHYENSLVLPSFDLEDFLLRYFECRTAAWRKEEFRRLDYPELIVTGWQSVRLGRNPLEFEVIGLPISNRFDTVTIHLDICDTSGMVLKTFEPKTFKLDRINVERFSVPSADYAAQRGVVPRLRYDWAGDARKMNYAPMTLIDPSMKPYLLYWARSTKNELRVNGENTWTFNGAKPGETAKPRRNGLSQISCGIRAAHQGDKKRIGMGYRRLRRDYAEIAGRKDGSKDLSGVLALPTPAPGGALHWYTLEGVNRESRSYQTLPVWETDGSKAGLVKVPLWLADGSVREVEVEECRVPEWRYTFEDDYGKLLADVSGWTHNGQQGFDGFGGGHLTYTGYNHYHNGQIGDWKDPARAMYRRGADGRGHLAFNGTNDAVMIQGGTAFPGAFTYELVVRPAELGREMGLLGTGNHQIHLDVLADGRVRAARGTPQEEGAGRRLKNRTLDSCTGEGKLKVGEWTKLAVVYDLRTMTLYVDGKSVASVPSKPEAGHEWLNYLIVGAKCKWVWTPVEFFHGDIGEMRFTGRSLMPDDLL